MQWSNVKHNIKLLVQWSNVTHNKPSLQSEDIRKLGSFRNNLVSEFSEMRCFTSFKKLFSLGVSRNEIWQTAVSQPQQLPQILPAIGWGQIFVLAAPLIWVKVPWRRESRSPVAPRVEVPGDKMKTQKCWVLAVYRPLRTKSAIPHPITIQNMRFEQ